MVRRHTPEGPPYPDDAVVRGADEGGYGVAGFLLHLLHRLVHQKETQRRATKDIDTQQGTKTATKRRTRGKRKMVVGGLKHARGYKHRGQNVRTDDGG